MLAVFGFILFFLLSCCFACLTCYGVYELRSLGNREVDAKEMDRFQSKEKVTFGITEVREIEIGRAHV